MGRKTKNVSRPSNERHCNGMMSIDPDRIRFQHSRIRPFFSGCGRSLVETLEAIQDGQLHPSELPPIQVIIGPTEDSEQPWYFSLNNRRLWIFKECRRQGLLENNQIAVRVKVPKSKADVERYNINNCSLDAIIMRESTTVKDDSQNAMVKDESKAATKKTKPTKNEISEEPSLGDMDPEKLSEYMSLVDDDSDIDDDEPESLVVVNRFAFPDASDSDEGETDRTAHEISTYLSPSPILGEQSITRELSGISLGELYEEAVERQEKDMGIEDLEGHGDNDDYEHLLCIGMIEPPLLIDNSSNVYVSFKLNCGVTVCCAPGVQGRCSLALDDLESDLRDCLSLLPKNVHGLVRRTRVWVNESYQYGPISNPLQVHHTTAHHHPGWLALARDRLDKTHGIEIYNCADYRRMRQHWNGSGLMLHELCHILHQFALSDGLENTRVIEAFNRARNSRLYENVRRRDWAGKDEDFDLAYAMVNCKEFFAEMSVTYWSRGYQDLDTQDETQVLVSSPPIMEDTVLERIRSQMPERAKEANAMGAYWDQPTGAIHTWVHNLFSSKQRKHLLCNKFYPFTSGQLKHYDRATYEAMDQLWKEICQWKDPHDEKVEACHGNLRACFKKPSGRKLPLTIFGDTVNL